MNEISLFPPTGDPPPVAGGPDTWTDSELTRAVRAASPHVQYLLRELSEAPFVRASQMKSQRVAYAIAQRICSSARKDPMVLIGEEEGERVYSLNPKYRSVIAPLVAQVEQPPQSEPKPRKPRGMGLGRSRRMSATTGIATTGISMTPGPVRRIRQASSGRSLTLPADIRIQFCQDLMAFLNSTGSTRYRIVLDSSGPRLELS